MTSIRQIEHLQRARAAKAARYTRCLGCDKTIRRGEALYCAKCRHVIATAISGAFETTVENEGLKKRVEAVMGTATTRPADAGSTADASTRSPYLGLSEGGE